MRCVATAARSVRTNNFGVMLDTFYDRRNGVMFYTNPLGRMMDIQIPTPAARRADTAET